jgi:adenylate cyclase
MTEARSPGAEPPETHGRNRKLGEAARRTDSRPGLISTARFIRRLLPGDQQYGDALSTTGDELPQHLGRLVSELRSERPSAVRELGLGVLQAWQALSESQRRGLGTAEVAILFTDLVSFSSWALDAGDEAALELLRKVGAAEQREFAQNGGLLVKRLGDGSMAVFSAPQDAVQAALALQQQLARIDVGGHTPQIRAGVHVGRPRKIGGDYLGVDVNIAARVGDAAKAGEVLVSENVRERLDLEAFSFGRKRRLRAAGAPRELVVYPVKRSGRSEDVSRTSR